MTSFRGGKKHGGARAGSGRKPLPDHLKAKPRTFKLSDMDVLELEALAAAWGTDKTKVIRRLVNMHFRTLDKPELQEDNSV